MRPPQGNTLTSRGIFVLELEKSAAERHALSNVALPILPILPSFGIYSYKLVRLPSSPFDIPRAVLLDQVSLYLSFLVQGENSMTEMTKPSASRRQFLTLGLKALAVAVPAAAVLAGKPKEADAAYRRVVRRRRRWWW
jgi:hypothetical protein